jgi:hypothetical protein
VDRDTLVQAWGDHILRALPARAKALYSAGRFVSVDGSTAVFALPNAAHCDRCEDVRSVVEDAVAAHLGSAVALTLVVDGPDSGSGSAAAGSSASGGPAPASPHPRRAAASATPTAFPASAVASRGAAPSAGGAAGVPDDEEVFDPDDVVDAVPIESVAEARVREAFPGAEEV